MGQSPGRPGRRSHGWSLRAQLVVALAVAVALFGAAAALLTARAYRQDRAAAGRLLASLARAAATRLDSQVTQSQQALGAIAAQDAPPSRIDPDGARAAGRRVLRQRPYRNQVQRSHGSFLRR